MHKSIVYHTHSMDGVKLCGGSFSGVVDMETVNRLVRAYFTVSVSNSGRAIFIDRKGSEVLLTLTINAGSTDAGAAAVKAWRIEQKARAEEAARTEEMQRMELEALLRGMSHADAVDRLTAR